MNLLCHLRGGREGKMEGGEVGTEGGRKGRMEVGKGGRLGEGGRGGREG